jgi:hypothetical protein
VPFAAELHRAGLAVIIDALGEHRLPEKFKKHPAYHEAGDGDWVCFAPAHWQAELEEQARAAQEREQRAKEAAEAERKKATGRKQLVLAEVPAETYRKFTGASEALLDLVPDEKKQAAKDFGGGRTVVVTDTALADKLAQALQRAIRKNRRDKLPDLEERMRKKIAALKKPGPRELAWLMWLLVADEARGFYVHLAPTAATAAEVKLPAGVLQKLQWKAGEDPLDHREKRLALLAKADGAALFKTIMAELLPRMLADVEASGPHGTGAYLLRWWLETATLWLYEETADGLAELTNEIKNAGWYQKELAQAEAPEAAKGK